MYQKSMDLLQRGLDVIPLATQTFSKGYRYFPRGAFPVYLERGQGSHVWDVDGNEFIDYICSLCPITLGYAYPATDNAIIEQLRKGIIFSLPSPLEVQLAEVLRVLMPWYKFRFLKTGSEATQGAVRIARYHTKRMHIAYRGYHGWHEWYAVASERPDGIPPVYGQYMHQFEYNNIDSLEAILKKHDCACIIMEPLVIDYPTGNFLGQVRELADKYQCLLIFDEIVTGFRLDMPSASKHFSVRPDLITFGKGMANGMPIACIGGLNGIMDSAFERVFVSSTFGGECLSLTASIATIQEMIRVNAQSHMLEMAKLLKKGLSTLGIATSGGYRPMISEKLSDKEKAVFLELLAKNGVMVHSNLVFNFCYSHSEKDIDHTLNVIEQAWKKLGTTEPTGLISQVAFKRI